MNIEQINSKIINALPDIIFYKNYSSQDGKYILCNDAFSKFVGKPISEIINKTDIELFGKEIGTFFRMKDKEVLLNNSTLINEEEVTYPDGTKVWLSSSKTPFYDKDNNITGIVGISRDITQQRVDSKNIEKQKEELENQKELYELVFKNTSSSVLILDIEANKFIDCNEPAIDILKCDSKDEVLNLQPADLSPEFQPDGRRSDEKSDVMNAIAVKNCSHIFDWKHLTKDGLEFWVEVILTPITLHGKKVLHVVWKDIADRKALEEKDKIHALELEQSVIEEVEKNRKKDQQLVEQSRLAQMGEMIGMIAHQWRQPLGAISSTSIDMKMQSEFEYFDLKQKEEAQKYEAYINNGLDQINEFVQNLTTTIDDFRNFFKPNKELEFISVREPVQKALKIVKPSFASDGIEIVETCTICNKKAKLYSNEMMQVILNILKNSQDNFKEKAIKDPKITIACECPLSDTYFLKIFDNGGGIAEDIIEKIFDPYFSTKDEKNGTGLGLYMSKTIIEDHHNGKLSVENTDDGVCFTIEFEIISEKEKL